MSSNRRVEIGPQSLGDSDLARRLRLHQSWYRAEVLNLPCGTGPRSTSTTPYGNMLTDEDAEAGKNFLTPEIFALARERIKAGPGVEPFRCTHNMLSSQPMCFNLFGPLVGDSNSERAARMFKALLGQSLDIGEVTQVAIEFAPPKELCMNDRTSFDAFIEYKASDGTSRFVGIETKLSEPFTAKEFKNDAYARVTSGHPAVWPGAPMDRLRDQRWAQLWRNHMLVESYRDSRPDQFAAGALMLVRHDLDGKCKEAADGYRRLLGEGACFLEFTLSSLLDAWDAVAHDDERAWLAAFRQRYVDLSGSELAYQAWIRAGRP